MLSLSCIKQIYKYFIWLLMSQDWLSGQKLGNLIALPFYKPALSSGNSCFVDEEFRPHRNQWEFLKYIKRADTTHLDMIYRTLSGKNTIYAGSSGLSLFKDIGAGSDYSVNETEPLVVKVARDEGVPGNFGSDYSPKGNY